MGLQLGSSYLQSYSGLSRYVQGIPIRLSNTPKSVHFTTVTQGGFTGVNIIPLPELLFKSLPRYPRRGTTRLGSFSLNIILNSRRFLCGYNLNPHAYFFIVVHLPPFYDVICENHTVSSVNPADYAASDHSSILAILSIV